MSTSLRPRCAAAALAALLSWPAAVLAQPPAIAAKAVNLRAGPGRDYPLVLRVAGGTPLAVQGCLDGYSWCDVIVPGNSRGWVYAGNIAYAYQDNRVPLLQYGAAIGLPIIGFTLGSYWGDYYRNRPFYRDRGRWEHRPPPGRPAYGGPPPGAGRPGFVGRPGPDGGRFHNPGNDHGVRPTDAGRPGAVPGKMPSGRPEGAGGRPDLGGPPNAGGMRPGGGRPEGEPRGGERGGGDRGGDRGGERGGDHGNRPNR